MPQTEKLKSSVLLEEDYITLAQRLRIPQANLVIQRLSTQSAVSSFTVTQLKEIIKFMRTKLHSINGTPRPFPPFLVQTGLKAALVDAVVQGMRWDNNHTNNTTHTNGVIHNNTPSNAMGTQYGATQQQAYAGYVYNGIAQQQQQQQQPQISGGYYTASGMQYQQQQLLHHQQNLTQLSRNINFVTLHRSPFYHVEKRLGTIPILPRRRITFRIALDENDVDILHNPEGQKELHLRLFSFQLKHEEWNTSDCEVTINNTMKEIDKRQNKQGVKKRGYHITKPLNISLDSATTMDFEISSNTTFHGIAVVEFARVYELEEIRNRVISRSQTTDSKEKECAICKKTDDLLRCSRCKSIWYCGTKHQEKDWVLHQTVCTPHDSKPQLKSVQISAVDDEIQYGETRVSLRCPLTICRISKPVRGSNCVHPQCIDLNAFLSFSHRTGCWQCPVCTSPLPFDELVVDEKMEKILSGTDCEVDQVRLFPDGKYIPITLEEQIEEDRRTQEVRRNKRRTPTDGHNDIDRLPPNLRENSDVRPDVDSPSGNQEGQNMNHPICLSDDDD